MPDQLDYIRTRVTDGLAKVATKQVAIAGDTCIVRDLEIDSLAVMNLILVLEDEFDISMPLDRVADIVTVDDLVAAVDALVKESSP